MAPTFTFPELNAEQGTNTADGLRNVANTAADMVCDLWQNYSEFTSSWADPTGVGKFNNALLSRLCEPRNKRPPVQPVSAFFGGQCPKLYTVTYSLRYGPNNSTAGPITISNVLGPIQGFYTRSVSPGRKKYGIKFQPNQSRPTGDDFVLEGNDADVMPVQLLSLTATPMSGSDNCGNPPPTYPPKVPGPNDVKKNVNVNVGAGVAVFAPVTLIPTRFNVDAEINPQINVSVGPFNVTFDAGGVTLSPNFNFGNQPKVLPDSNSTPNIILPPQDSKKGTNCPDVKVPATDLTPVISRLDSLKELSEEIQECSCPIAYDAEVVNVGGPSRSGEGVLPRNTVRVNLFLIQIPDNAKVQFAGEDAPLQYFCGYVAFGNGVTYGPRIPVNTARSTFEVPVWATSFYWGLYAGFTARVERETLVPEKPDAELAVRQMKKKPA